tara:strand:+ start:411 stop:1958 length:1548 start_codon:yes stop_codon:yes gene_type:complete
MANFNIPNLCGASPDLNGALDEINKLKDKLLSSIDVDASELKADLETSLGDLKAAFDKLEIELPEAPNVNFQAEITSLINDIDKTTIQGIAAFNAKLASLKLDFGDTLSEKGINFDDLIASAETKLAGGGNVCDTVANLEIPAGSSGTGITTETKEERGSGTSITISETPKEIISVLGKKTGNNFFGNASYKQSGRTITTTISYAEIKVTYTINLVKEKPIATKQPSKDGEKEEVSIVSKNTKSVEKNVQSKIQSLLKKIDVKGISGLATEKENAGIQTALGKLSDGSFKEDLNKQIAKAQEEQKKIWQDPLNYKRVVAPSSSSIEIAASAVKAAQDTGANINKISSENKTTREVKVTTTENRNTVTQTTTTINTKKGGSTKITTPKTEKSTISTNGFATRKIQMEESFTTDSSLDLDGFKLVDNISKGIELKQEPFSINYVEGRVYEGDETVATYLFDNEDRENSNMIAAFVKDSSPPKVAFIPDTRYALGINRINALFINYTVLEKIDPNFKG